jgi:hypothetical protein
MSKIYLSPLAHPYARYGLAVALLQEQITPEELSEDNVVGVLTQAIESGLGHFRLATQDNPDTAEVLRFEYIKLADFQRSPNLIQGKLAAQGKYLAPSLVSTDGDAGDTYKNAVLITELLSNGSPLEKSIELKRSFAPTTTKINNGKKSQSPPSATLFEAACSAIATLTHIKPAAWSEKQVKPRSRVLVLIEPTWN